MSALGQKRPLCRGSATPVYAINLTSATSRSMSAKVSASESLETCQALAPFARCGVIDSADACDIDHLR